MRFFEFSTLKPIKPMNPAQHRIYAKKQQIERDKDALKREKDAQKRKREQEAHWKKPRQPR